jgi:hypothetical protein
MQYAEYEMDAQVESQLGTAAGSCHECASKLRSGRFGMVEKARTCARCNNAFCKSHIMAVCYECFTEHQVRISHHPLHLLFLSPLSRSPVVGPPPRSTTGVSVRRPMAAMVPV